MSPLVKKRIRIILVVVAGLGVLTAAGVRVFLWDKYTVPIMMYHHVRANPQGRADTVSPERFRAHMLFLKRRGYNVIRLDELVQGIRHNRDFPRDTVVVTFDDGYEDNYLYAVDVLKELSLPAIFFVIPGFVNGHEGERYLNFDQMRAMAAAGLDFGSHTAHHTYLPEASDPTQEFEIVQSKKILEAELKRPVRYFSYPIGGFNDAIKKKIRQAGYRGAMTTNRGHDFANGDVYELNRIRFGDTDTSSVVLAVKLSGYYHLFRKQKDPY